MIYRNVSVWTPSWEDDYGLGVHRYVAPSCGWLIRWADRVHLWGQLAKAMAAAGLKTVRLQDFSMLWVARAGALPACSYVLVEGGELKSCSLLVTFPSGVSSLVSACSLTWCDCWKLLLLLQLLVWGDPDEAGGWAWGATDGILGTPSLRAARFLACKQWLAKGPCFSLMKGAGWVGCMLYMTSWWPVCFACLSRFFPDYFSVFPVALLYLEMGGFLVAELFFN